MFLTALVLAALTANADPIPAPNSTPPPSTQVQPIRMAKAVVRIYKQTYDGNISTTVAPVCQLTTDVPVFDTRGIRGIWWSQGADVGCTSTLGPTPVMVRISASINLTDQRDPIDHADRKYFESSLWVASYSPNPMPTGDYNARGVSAWSRDLSMHTMGLDMQPSVLWLCIEPGPSKSEPFPDPNPPAKQKLMRTNATGNCKPTLNEWFNATIEFQD